MDSANPPVSPLVKGGGKCADLRGFGTRSACANACHRQRRPTAPLRSWLGFVGSRLGFVSSRLGFVVPLLGFTLALANLSGCATPAGVLFPAIDSPKVWPAPPETPRIRWLGAIASSDDLKAPRSTTEVIRAVFRGPRPAIGFSSPHNLAIAESRFLAVADGSGGAVHILDLVERTHRKVTGFGNEFFRSPMDVAWVGRRLFVTDAVRHEVVELDVHGAFQHRFGGDQLSRPVGITYVPRRKMLYVVDGGAHKIALFEPDGTPVITLGRRGSGFGDFNFPTYIDCRGDRLLVADTGNFRVQLLDLNGAPVATIGKKGDAAGDLSMPKGVAIDRDGHIYVVDAHFENVQIFDQAGRLLMAFGETGTKPGRFWLPAGVMVDDEDHIWVADAGNRRLQVFEYLRASP